jgi:hypothetical protein
VGCTSFAAFFHKVLTNHGYSSVAATIHKSSCEFKGSRRTSFLILKELPYVSTSTISLWLRSIEDGTGNPLLSAFSRACLPIWSGKRPIGNFSCSGKKMSLWNSTFYFSCRVSPVLCIVLDSAADYKPRWGKEGLRGEIEDRNQMNFWSLSSGYCSLFFTFRTQPLDSRDSSP